MSETPLDMAYAAMQAAADDDGARLRFYERLADAELFIMLEKEPQDDQIAPEIFETADATFVLVFDTEDRLSRFVNRTVAYAALSGRAIANMLAGQGIGLAVNPEVAPSAILIPPTAVDWLADMLTHAPDEVEARPVEFSAPTGLPEVLLKTLDAKLATAAGLAQNAYLTGVTYENGVKSHLLGFVGALTEAEPALARAVNEALTFSGTEAAALDVGFFDPADAMVALLARKGLRFDLPVPNRAKHPASAAPGSDPDNPPKLR
ncbi:SseB family protein [Pseudopelagicola sp. nBUS_19]|uniref:SseB family protein n=1 Tax=Pseudopelagicola sp. nBUS_19 TaxID=3395316 RepID=UPI003EBB8F6F